MEIQIAAATPRVLAAYATVPIAFEVTRQLRVEAVDQGLAGLRLVEEEVDPPWTKDYDGDREEGPRRWARRWDLRHWVVLSAFEGGVRVGGATVAWNTPEVDMLEGRTDLAALWDIRVRSQERGRRIGTHLFGTATRWAREQGCCRLKVETQNINVPACRFYARQGCVLGAIHCHAYARYPQEVQLLWYLDL